MRNINRLSRSLLRALALTAFCRSRFWSGNGDRALSSDATPKPGVNVRSARARLLPIDSSIPDDPDVEKIVAPYSERVRDLSKVIGRLEGDLKQVRCWRRFARKLRHRRNKSARTGKTRQTRCAHDYERRWIAQE